MDDFHHREKDIYLITIQASPESQKEIIDASLFFKFDFKKYPEIENLVSVKKYLDGEVKLTVGETSFSPEGIIADSTFFSIFDFDLMTGDEKTVLKDPNAVVLTEDFARKIFGKDKPVGKTVKITTSFEKNFEVKGIVKTPPSNSSLTFNFILPSHAGDFSRSGGNFILVNSNFVKSDFASKIKDLGHGHPQFKNSRMDVIAMDDIYFDKGGLENNDFFSRKGDKRSIQVLFVIVGIVFIITVLNFSNLQIISINSSVKNIGIKRISGAGIKQLFYQKFHELSVLILISVFLLTGAFKLALPWFNHLAGVKLSPELWKIVLLNFSVLSVLVLTAMIYPSIVYLRVPITSSLKDQIFRGNKLAGRKAVVIVQFALSFVLLIASTVVVKQLHLMLTKELGFETENTIRTKLFHRQYLRDSREEQMRMWEKVQKDYQYVKEELASHSSVEAYSQGLSPIQPFAMPWKIPGDGDYVTENALIVTPDYKDLFGLQLTEGRFFRKDTDKDRADQVVINEAAKKYWNIGDISNTRILNKYWAGENGFEIIGVVKDFNYEHLSVKPQPLIMLFFDDIDSDFLIKFKEGAEQAGLSFVQQLFSTCNPGETFSCTFLSDDIEALYQKEKRLSQIYILFTITAFLISATGLFTIALYDTRKRTKEIGIRKVNGARVSEVMAMLNIDFVKWVVIAFVIATPIAWYAMHKWLESFAYKTALSWWIFALAGLLALGIALLTVSWQSWKAATRNPVEALRYE
jgi:putative ABC transport system permease protein